jgi:hypothetical protein
LARGAAAVRGAALCRDFAAVVRRAAVTRSPSAGASADPRARHAPCCR